MYEFIYVLYRGSRSVGCMFSCFGICIMFASSVHLRWINGFFFTPDVGSDDSDVAVPWRTGIRC